MPKISVPVNDTKEYEAFREHAKARGFDGNLAAYVRWLIRDDMRQLELEKANGFYLTKRRGEFPGGIIPE